MSLPTTASTKLRPFAEEHSIRLSDSLSPDSTESPTFPEPGRTHYKVYRAIDEEKRKYVGRCWSENAESAALRLGTRGLAREDCTTIVFVENVIEPQEPERFEVRQFFGEISPMAEAKYAEKGNLSPDGRMKYKEIVRKSTRSPVPRSPPSKTPSPKRADQSKFSIPSAASSEKRTIMVPIWTEVQDEGYGFSSPWSAPSLQPTATRPKQRPTPQKKPVVPIHPRRRPHLTWELNPNEKYSSSVKTAFAQ